MQSCARVALANVFTFVTFEWNTLLDLSGVAATKTLGMLQTQLLSEVLGESTRALSVRMICGG